MMKEFFVCNDGSIVSDAPGGLPASLIADPARVAYAGRVVVSVGAGDVVQGAQIERGAVVLVTPEEGDPQLAVGALGAAEALSAADLATIYGAPVDIVPAPATVSAEMIKEECRRRIYAVASNETQMNMTAASAAGALDESSQAAFAASLAWVAGMRAACSTLIAANDATYRDDGHWPACPAEVVALAAAF